jgi:protein arginine N-methyltransferase 1
MYSVSGYGSMIADRVRMSAYTQALRDAVKPGSVVLDIGTGTGIFALLACQFGARKVYAVEPGDVIEIARSTARANGRADDIEFLQDFSTSIVLPERADLIISDMRGVLPLYQHHLPSIIDARKRLLSASGRLIPRRDDLWVAMVESEKFFRERINFWEDHGYDLDLRPAKSYIVNSWRREIHQPEQLVVEPLRWATIDYALIESPNVQGEVRWTVERGGTANGLAVWFDAILSDTVSFSNAPGQPELIYGQAFFPWSSPVKLEIGDEVSVKIFADLIGEDYLWRWDTEVLDHARYEKVNFKQSNFFATPLSPAQLRKRASDYQPALNEDGQMDGLILSLMNGENSLGEIAQRVMEHFPIRFGNWQEALNRVADLSKRYG